ncbi:MAG: hypothetical protein ACRD0C_18230, partial [Acidimicrobiia bacterium]
MKSWGLCVSVARRIVSVVVLAVLAGGCGSRVTQAELEAAGGRLASAAPAVGAPAALPPETGGRVGAAEEPSPGAGAGTATLPAGPSGPAGGMVGGVAAPMAASGAPRASTPSAAAAA